MKKVVIYGAGNVGKYIYGFLKYKGFKDTVYCFCDRNADLIKKVDEIKVVTLDKVKSNDVLFIIAVQDKIKSKEIENELRNACRPYYLSCNEWAAANGFDMTSWNRDFCAYYHIDEMNSYFDSAEEESYLKMFWDDETYFCNMFQKLDLENVVELACGRGRHVPRYINKAGKITLVDILEKNIKLCKDRFGDNSKLVYYCNNGFDLKKLVDSSYTSLFTYDSMVHFEMMDIYQYLKDIHRILKPGGYGLFHHSNNTSDYRLSYMSAPHGRNYMSKDIFAYLSCRAGFEVIEQQLFDWGIEKNLDCLTLIKKPN
jgi:ubiquinone/menaquinone biosynthesis C-methylase UbiE